MFVVSRVRTISKRLDFSTNGIVTIYQNTFHPGNIDLSKNSIIGVNGFIKNLKAYARISSLADVKLPNFHLEDSETDKLYKVLDVEWNSPRKQLNLYISDGRTWELVGAISLLNPAGYPYRMYNLMDLYTDNLAIELGENGKLGVEVQDVGYGALVSSDKVTIHGSYTEEIITDSKPLELSTPTICTPYKWDVVSEESQVLLPANDNRKYAIIINTLNTTAWVNLGSTAEIGRGIPLLGKGGSYEIVSNNMYKGDISIISSELATITGTECI